ncbi:response regulator transcription factor [Euzebya sp.]|uniref:response regulator transcription factor n=1 Tax=Euzebya sp. TaxID=1971409 RepID=UPI0035150DD5
MNRILIVEDEPRIAAFIEKGLRAKGFATTAVGDGQTALAHLRRGGHDLVVLDLGLPDTDGIAVLEELRGVGDGVPVLVLTARDDVGDTVGALESGADDYMTKPFAFDELVARIRLRLRRGGAGEPEVVLRRGRVSLDLQTRRVRLGEREVELTAREIALLELFMRHAGQVLSREQILNRIWGYDHDPASNVVDVYVGYLRRKLAADVIETVRGMGYRFTDEP